MIEFGRSHSSHGCTPQRHLEFLQQYATDTLAKNLSISIRVSHIDTRMQRLLGHSVGRKASGSHSIVVAIILLCNAEGLTKGWRASCAGVSSSSLTLRESTHGRSSGLLPIVSMHVLATWLGLLTEAFSVPIAGIVTGSPRYPSLREEIRPMRACNDRHCLRFGIYQGPGNRCSCA